MLPQPFVTSALSQVEGLRVALDMNEEWQKVAGSKLVTGVLVVRKDAVETDPERVRRFHGRLCQASVEAANTDLEGTAALCEEYGIVAKAALAQKALPQCNIVFETGDEMKTDLDHLLSASCSPLTPPVWAAPCRPTTSTMQAKSDLIPSCRGGCEHRPLQTPLWQKAAAILAVWIRDLAVCRHGAGARRAVSGYAFANAGGAGAAGTHGCVLAAHRIQCAAHSGGLPAGSSRGACCWVRWVPAGIGCGCSLSLAMQLIRAMPVASFVILALLWVRSANLSVVVSFTHVLPVVYAGVLGGIADTDPQAAGDGQSLPPAAHPHGCGISGCPAFSRRSAKAALPPWACAGRAASRPEVIGLPDHSASATRSTAPKSRCPHRMCSPGRWLSCCCRRCCPP